MPEAVDKSLLMRRVAAAKTPPKPLALPPKPETQPLAWFYRTMVQPYLDHGSRNPRWDHSAVQALWVAGQYFSHESNVPQVDDAFAACEAALADGCDDPLVRYCYYRTFDHLNVDPAAGPMFMLPLPGSARQMAVLAGLMQRTDYPAVRKCLAALWAGELLANNAQPNSQRWLQAVQNLNEAETFLAGVCQDKETPRNDLYQLSSRLIKAYVKLGQDGKATLDRILAQIGANAPDSAFLPTLTGDFYIGYAWEARGYGFASTVSQQGWQLMGQRLGVARKTLKSAWAQNPKDSTIARMMISVCLGETGNVNEMEQWFQRAMNLDPNDVDACAAKWMFLLPRWYGSHEETAAFGRDCLKRYNSGQALNPNMALQLVKIHGWLAREKMQENGMSPAQYFALPEVWNDIDSVYKSILQRHPQSRLYRSQYALAAARAAQWAVAKQMFDSLDDDCITITLFGCKEEYDAVRAKAAR